MRKNKNWPLPLILLAVLTSQSYLAGCGSGSPVTPQQQEEARQQHIKRAERMRQESSPGSASERR
jgi:hypothetical protein